LKKTKKKPPKHKTTHRCEKLY